MSKPAAEGFKDGNAAVDKVTDNIGEMSTTLTDI